MDFSIFSKMAVAGIPLLFPVIGLVEWFKTFKNKDGSQMFNGNQILLISMGWGLVLGGGFAVANTPPPVGNWQIWFVYVFSVFIYGVSMGLVSSGLYDVIVGIVSKFVPKLQA